MTEILNATLLGIVQGLTEFLPISSSGHLEIVTFMVGDDSHPHSSLFMTVVLHVATALSTIVVFRRDILDLIHGLLQFRLNDECLFCMKIVLSMVPAVIVGLVWKQQIESLFNQNLTLVGSMLVVTGGLLLVADRSRNQDQPLNFWKALVIGVIQALAILPGISRSGATIATSLWLGIDRQTAARFSFLMVLPVIFGAIAKDLYDSVLSGEAHIQAEGFRALAFGFAAAFVTGWFACRWMIQIVRSSKLHYFAMYCFIVAAIAIAKGLEVF